MRRTVFLRFRLTGPIRFCKTIARLGNKSNLMKKLCLTILLFGVCCGIRVRADVLVYDSFFSLNPDPVNIATGEAVFWTDADGDGPYGIYSTAGYWNTVTDGYGIRFTQAGTYNYCHDNG